MLTIVTAAKPFRGRTATIQRNALRSWMQLHEDVQIVLFGDAAGTQEVAWELGLHYEAAPQLASTGVVRLDYMLATARRHARHNILCYIACDVLLQGDMCAAINRVEALHHEFVMVGRARAIRAEDADTYNSAYVTSNNANNADDRSQGSVSQNSHAQLDYVIFPRNCFVGNVTDLPADSPIAAKWLMRRATANDVPVVDVSAMVRALKQIGAETAHPMISDTGLLRKGKLCAEEKQVLFGEYGHLMGMVRAPYSLTPKDIVRNRWMVLRHWGMEASSHGALVSRAWRGLKMQLQKPHAVPATEIQPGINMLRRGLQKPR